MKKLLLVILMAVLFVSLCSCGTGYAEITGVGAAIINFDSNGDIYSKDCVDDSTLTENDYLIKVGERYQIVIELTFTGGSIVPSFESDAAEDIKLIFDGDLMQIGKASANHGYLYYPFECKNEFTCAAILIEYGEYHTEVIVSTMK